MSKINTESHIYRITGLTPILGSLPAIKELRDAYTASKAPADEAAENGFDVDDRGLTVFARDKRGQLCVMAYQLKGFFKAALYAIAGQYYITAYKSKVDLMIFPEPRFIPLLRDGKPIMGEDEILERPLRRNGRDGESICLAASELIEDPWSFDVEISMLPSRPSKKGTGDPLTWEVLEAAMDYGGFHGLGQWRNADYGRFIWERVE